MSDFDEEESLIVLVRERDGSRSLRQITIDEIRGICSLRIVTM